MIRHPLLLVAIATFPASGVLAAPATPGTVASMHWQRRIVLVGAPGPRDPQLLVQRRILDEWRQGGADRDISLVQIVGNRVIGASDPAGVLRRRYDLPGARFGVLLIGKDGHVAMRSAQPIASGDLQGSIDAMPMRKAGQR